MSESEQGKIEIAERDKPFVLAVISSAITVMCVVLGAVGACLHNTSMTETAVDALKFTFPLTTMSWGFYFKTK